MDAAAKQLMSEGQKLEREPLPIFELTVRPVIGDAPADEELLHRLDHVTATEMPVLLTRLSESYQVTEYLRRYTQEPIRFTVGAASVVQLFETSYGELLGGRLEALGRLLAKHVRIYIFPLPLAVFRDRLKDTGLDPDRYSVTGKDPVTAQEIKLPLPGQHLYSYLLESGWVVGVKT